MPNYRQIVEDAGGLFISVQEMTIYFWDPAKTRVLSLYLSACTPENVALTLKTARKEVREIPSWEPTAEVRSMNEMTI
jgi:hypothetical protein